MNGGEHERNIGHNENDVYRRTRGTQHDNHAGSGRAHTGIQFKEVIHTSRVARGSSSGEGKGAEDDDAKHGQNFGHFDGMVELL